MIKILLNIIIVTIMFLLSKTFLGDSFLIGYWTGIIVAASMLLIDMFL